MAEKIRKKLAAMDREVRKSLMLLLVFVLIGAGILIVGCFTPEKGDFTDEAASRIAQEMAANHIVLSSGRGRRTVADFQEPILMTHGKDSRLIVHTAHLSETVSIASEGFLGWAWTSSYQDIAFAGDAQYTVDLSQLKEEDFAVNNEMQTVTVRIPYAVLEPIHIPDEQIKFMDVKKGWIGPKDIKMTPEENAQLRKQVHKRMKAKLIDENTLAAANKSAKTVVAGLLTAAVHSVDPNFRVIVVQ